MPSHELSGQFDLLVSDMMNCGKLGSKGQQKKMMACFGTLPMVAAKIWELIDEEGCTNDKHLKGKPVTSKAKPQHRLVGTFSHAEKSILRNQAPVGCICVNRCLWCCRSSV